MWNSSAYYFTFDTDVWLVSGPPGFDRIEDMNQLARSPGRLMEFRREFGKEVLRVELQAGIKVIARRNGMLIFDFGGMPSALVSQDIPEPVYFDSRVEAMAKRVSVMNAHLFCLHSSFLELDHIGRRNMRVTARDLIHVSEDGTGMGGPGLLQVPLGTGFETREIFRPEVISEGSLVHSLEKLDRILLHPLPQGTALVALLNEAHVSYQEHNYQLALVSAWTICEAMLNHQWREYLDYRSVEDVGDEPITIIDKQRRERLERSPDLSASIIAEILNLSDGLSLERYKLLNVARRGRNRWLHGLAWPEASTAQAALQSASEMLEEELGTRLALSLGRTI